LFICRGFTIRLREYHSFRGELYLRFFQGGHRFSQLILFICSILVILQVVVRLSATSSILFSIDPIFDLEIVHLQITPILESWGNNMLSPSGFQRLIWVISSSWRDRCRIFVFHIVPTIISEIHWFIGSLSQLGRIYL
jgi:hypothetical protein